MMKSIDVTVDVSLDDFDEDDLLEYIGECGYVCMREDEFNEELSERRLDKEEVDYLISLVEDHRPGSFEWKIYNKLKDI